MKSWFEEREEGLAWESIGRKGKKVMGHAEWFNYIWKRESSKYRTSAKPTFAYSLTILVSCSNVKSRRNLQAWFDTFSTHNSLAGTFLLVTAIMLWKSPPCHEPSFPSNPPNFYSLQFSTIYKAKKSKIKGALFSFLLVL